MNNLNKDTTEIKLQATDDIGNVAESSFQIGVDTPTLSYERVSRTPTSILIKGVRVDNFSSADTLTLTFECDGHDIISHTWKNESTQDLSVDKELPGYGCTWTGGTIIAKVSDGTCSAECEILIEGAGESESHYTVQLLSSSRIERKQVGIVQFQLETEKILIVSKVLFRNIKKTFLLH